MFFIISQLFSWLIAPISQIIILVAVVLFVRGRIHLISRYLLIIAILFYSSPITSWIALSNWETDPVPYKDIGKTYDYGIVLCGMSNMLVYPPDRPHFNDNVDRITDAVVLYNQGIIKKILLSGGSGYLEFPELKESTRLKQFLMELGIDPVDIIIEDQSKNTRENAYYSAQLVKTESILLITSASHMRRAIGCFEKVGLQPDYFTSDVNSSEFKWSYKLIIPSISAIGTWTEIIHELVGYLMYWLVGYI